MAYVSSFTSLLDEEKIPPRFVVRRVKCGLNIAEPQTSFIRGPEWIATGPQIEALRLVLMSRKCQDRLITHSQ